MEIGNQRTWTWFYSNTVLICSFECKENSSKIRRWKWLSNLEILVNSAMKPWVRNSILIFGFVLEFKVLQLFNQHQEIFLTSHWLTDRINGIDAFSSASPFFLQGTRNGDKNFKKSSCVYKFYKKFKRIFLTFQLSHGFILNFD